MGNFTYTQAQLSGILAAAVCCLARTVYKGVRNSAFYKDPHCQAYLEGTKVGLYTLALKAWSQNADGSVPVATGNPYSQESFAAMAGYLAHHCGTGPIIPLPPMGWRGNGTPTCIQVSGQNTGMAGYAVLEQYLVSSGVATGVTKLNATLDPNYLPPALSLVLCPLPIAPVVYFGMGEAILAAPLTPVTFPGPSPKITFAYNSAGGQYIWISYPSSLGTLSSVLDLQGAQMISAYSPQPPSLVAGVPYSNYRMNYPVGILSSYTLIFNFS